jgi:hypothetical protein
MFSASSIIPSASGKHSGNALRNASREEGLDRRAGLVARYCRDTLSPFGSVRADLKRCGSLATTAIKTVGLSVLTIADDYSRANRVVPAEPRLPGYG